MHIPPRKGLIGFIALGLLIALLPSRATAGAWTLPKGYLWTKTALFYQNTDEQFCTGDLGFCSRRDRAPFDPFTLGRSKSYIVFTDVAYGITDALDFGFQVPVYVLEFRDISNPNRARTKKIGDIRLYLKYRLLLHPVVVSLRGGVKTPTGGVNTDSEVVPVGEGQWDIEWFADVGRSISAIYPGYVNLNLGYRIRTENTDFNHDRGDEFSLLAESGWQISSRLMGKASVSYLVSKHPRSLGLTFNRERRELLAFTPGLLYTPSDRAFTIEVGVNLPITGQDLPAGPQWTVGFSRTFNLFGAPGRQ